MGDHNTSHVYFIHRQIEMHSNKEQYRKNYMYITKYQDIRQICNVFDNWY